MIDPRLERAVAEIGRYYQHRLLAVALFGSRARARSRADSDWDLLLVLVDSEPVRRSLYREWEGALGARLEAILAGVSPHFVHLPADEDGPSSLWLEVTTSHVILGDPTGQLSSRLRRIRELIEAGRFERRSVHGLPYWRGAG